MAMTSIHIKACKMSAEIHNRREKDLDYVRHDLSHLNEWHSTVTSLGDLRAELASLVKAKTGRKMQAKAAPLQEGVIVIQANTTMAHLKEVGRRFQNRWGVRPVQIAIHRDEGHWEDGKWKPNMHAHIVFDWINHSTGKMYRTSRADASEMQDIVAEVLGMERGVKSDKSHLDPLRFKANAAHIDLEKLTKQVKDAEKHLENLKDEVKNARKAQKEALISLESNKTLIDTIQMWNRFLEPPNDPKCLIAPPGVDVQDVRIFNRTVDRKVCWWVSAVINGVPMDPKPLTLEEYTAIARYHSMDRVQLAIKKFWCEIQRIFLDLNQKLMQVKKTVKNDRSSGVKM